MIDALGLAEDLEQAGFRVTRLMAWPALCAIEPPKTWLRSMICVSSNFAGSGLSRIAQKIADVQTAMIKWFTGVMIAQPAVIVVLIRLLPGGAF